ncbi:hypothetical protein R5W60_06730 [Brucella pseudintermedia]|uniref:hypothetical protein n=1 Tax=Brucella pseudintermedia TaxID=370111 RepID=UPI0036708375|nr:hypothetical protein R5W60_06730 [Brucella pseudintermedia]
MPDVEKVTITKSEYESLLDSSRKLNCLENGGVDNWEWYHESLKEGGYFDEEDEA